MHPNSNLNQNGYGMTNDDDDDDDYYDDDVLVRTFSFGVGLQPPKPDKSSKTAPSAILPAQTASFASNLKRATQRHLVQCGATVHSLMARIGREEDEKKKRNQKEMKKMKNMKRMKKMKNMKKLQKKQEKRMEERQPL